MTGRVKWSKGNKSYKLINLLLQKKATDIFTLENDDSYESDMRFDMNLIIVLIDFFQENYQTRLSQINFTV